MPLWDGYRLPEHALFCDSGDRFMPPASVTWVIVESDAAYDSKDIIQIVLKRDVDEL